MCVILQICNMKSLKQNEISFPVRRAHLVGTSFVVTLDPSHVKRLGIDELTFFVQKPIKGGILLELRKLSIEETSERNDHGRTHLQAGKADIFNIHEENRKNVI